MPMERANGDGECSSVVPRACARVLLLLQVWAWGTPAAGTSGRGADEEPKLLHWKRYHTGQVRGGGGSSRTACGLCPVQAASSVVLPVAAGHARHVHTHAHMACSTDRMHVPPRGLAACAVHALAWGSPARRTAT